MKTSFSYFFFHNPHSFLFCNCETFWKQTFWVLVICLTRLPVLKNVLLSLNHNLNFLLPKWQIAWSKQRWKKNKLNLNFQHEMIFLFFTFVAPKTFQFTKYSFTTFLCIEINIKFKETTWKKKLFPAFSSHQQENAKYLNYFFIVELTIYQIFTIVIFYYK